MEPTITSYLINTEASGDFNAVLSLITIKDIEIKDKDIASASFSLFLEYMNDM